MEGQIAAAGRTEEGMWAAGRGDKGKWREGKCAYNLPSCNKTPFFRSLQSYKKTTSTRCACSASCAGLAARLLLGGGALGREKVARDARALHTAREALVL